MELTIRDLHAPAVRLYLLFVLYVFSALAITIVTTMPARAAPGGFLEQPASAQIRAKLSATQIQSMLPARGEFTFPAPYNTQGVRVTNSTDCSGGDCVWPVGYSYWRNTNNHVGSDTMYIFLGLDQNRGGSGPTLFSYNKITGVVVNLGPLFSASSALSSTSGEGWYFSGTQPTTIYVNDGPRMLRYDVLTRQFQTVFDIGSRYGAGATIWQMHSSDDDRVHSFTVRAPSSYEMLGCAVYLEDSNSFQFFPKIGDFDECHIDKSGRWLTSLENVDGQYGLEMRIFDLSNGSERMVLDQDGAVGHADMGYGYVIGTDNWDNNPNAIKGWDFSQTSLAGSLVFHAQDWTGAAANHISHTNARPDVPIEQQFACGSNAERGDAAWANEVVCFRLDGSLNTLVVAPVMTDMNSPVGGDDYSKAPKGNLDVTGEYFIWTSNSGGNRMDAFIVKVPSQLLVADSGGTGGGSTPPPPATDLTPPVVSISSPVDGATLSGTVTLIANATDNSGIAGVQFQLDDQNIGAEDTTAPYSIDWNTASSFSGTHAVSAVARDAAGNTSVSIPVMVISDGSVVAPVITDVTASNITTSTATVTWTTNLLSDSQVEIGTTTAYGTTSALNTTAVTAHTVNLSGLSAGTLYHYRVRSRDIAGSLVLSDDGTFTTVAASTSTGPENVIWIEDVNVTVSGNSLTKTSGCDGCEDAGAISQQQINSANGFIEFTVSAETNLARYVGLNNAHVNTMSAEIPFAFKLVSGYAEVRELGQYRSDTSVVNGDVLRISVQAGVVTYAKNGEVFYTSGVTPILPLRADTSISSMNAAINNVIISGSAPQISGPQNVTWTSTANVTATGNSLMKTSGCDGCEDAGAISQQQISAGDGYLEFTVSETNLLRYVGLNNSHVNNSSAEIPFAFKLVSSYAEVRENGQYRSDIPVVSGDVLRISVLSGVVSYARNGVVFFTSSATPQYPLRADTSISNLNATVNNVVITSVVSVFSTPISIGQPIDTEQSVDLSASGGGGSLDPLMILVLSVMLFKSWRRRKIQATQQTGNHIHQG